MREKSELIIEKIVSEIEDEILVDGYDRDLDETIETYNLEHPESDDLFDDEFLRSEEVLNLLLGGRVGNSQIAMWARDTNKNIRLHVAQFDYTPINTLLSMRNDSDDTVRSTVRTVLKLRTGIDAAS